MALHIWTTFLVAAVCTLHAASTQESECRWKVESELPENPPVLYNTDAQDIVLPILHNGQTLINVSSTSHLELSCPGTKFRQWDTDRVRAQCKDGIIYVNKKDIKTGPDLESVIESAREESKRLQKAIQELQNKLQKSDKYIQDLEEQLVEQESNKNKMTASSLGEFGCSSDISVSLVPTKTPCGHNRTGHLHHLALLTANNFRTKILICFNETQRSTIWSKHTLYGAHITATDNHVNATVTYDKFGFKNMNEDIEFVYRTDTQKFLFSILFITDKATAAKYFNVEEDLYLSPSLLCPVEDFVFAMEQRAAQAFINTAPVWLTVARGNWEALEESIRGISSKNASKLTVYSGVAGVQVVEGHKLHLGAIVGEKNAIPVPSMLWKVIVEEATKRAVGFLVYNNPHMKKLPKSICPSVCSQLSWVQDSIVNSGEEDLRAGYTICCTLPDLLAALPQAQADLHPSTDWNLLT